MPASLSSRLGFELSRSSRKTPSFKLSKTLSRSLIPPTMTSVRKSEQAEEEKKAIKRQLARKWAPGDVYAPHDLSAAETRKWKKPNRPTSDIFDQLNINPLSLYKNFSVMSDYMTDMGRIQHSKVTGLRPVNQRKVAKAIRRAIALGLMPSVHKHPEILKRKHRHNVLNGASRMNAVQENPERRSTYGRYAPPSGSGSGT